MPEKPLEEELQEFFPRDKRESLGNLCQHVRQLVDQTVASQDIEPRVAISRLKEVLQQFDPQTITMVTETLRSRGVLRSSSEEPLSVERMSEECNNTLRQIVKDPDGIARQSFALAETATHLGRKLHFSPEERQNFVLAAMLMNSGKFTQLVEGRKDLHNLDPNEGDDAAAVEMLQCYNAREQTDYDALSEAGFDEDMTAILQENIRHDPSALKTLRGRLLHYLIYCFDPHSGKFVPVEERVPRAKQLEPMYDPLYRGYEITNGTDLLDDVRTAIATTEKELAEKLNIEPGKVRDYLNTNVLGLKE